jgi:hypothetical protein
MTDLTEQHVCNKFYFKLGKTPTETYKILKLTFKEDAMSGIQTSD